MSTRYDNQQHDHDEYQHEHEQHVDHVVDSATDAGDSGGHDHKHDLDCPIEHHIDAYLNAPKYVLDLDYFNDLPAQHIVDVAAHVHHDPDDDDFVEPDDDFVDIADYHRALDYINDSARDV